MSGQNRKIQSVKKSSGHSPTHSRPFFTYKPDLTFEGKEIKCNPKPGDLGKVYRHLNTH